MQRPAPSDAQTVALLGHDLRATLSEVIGGLRLIERDLPPSAPRAHLARTQAASAAMTLLLDNALALLGPTSIGPIPIGPTPIGLHTEHLMNSLRLRWQTRATEQGITLDLLAEDLPADLPLDPAGIERILANLLNNALRHAEAATVTCHLQITPARQLQITVQDQGKGFDGATLARLSSPEAAAPNPGAGLGLHIVRQIACDMGGQISAANHPAGGAKVVVLLPLAQPPAPQPAQAKAEPSLLQGRRVLVAAANDSARQRLSGDLTSLGAQVSAAADGLKVLKHLTQARFDALLIDIDMPHTSAVDTSAVEVIRHIRSQPGPLAHLPILAITADQSHAPDTALRAAGADAVLCAALARADTLCAALMQVLHRKPGLEPAMPQIEPAQFQELLDMAGPKMAAELLDHLQKDLRAAKRALLSAAQGPDWLEVRRQTHVMIALAGTAGANLLHQLAQSMNALAHQPVPDNDSLQRLLPQTLEQLDMLINFIDHKSANPIQHFPQAPAQEQT